MRVAAFTRPFPGDPQNGDAYFMARLVSETSPCDVIASSPQAPMQNPTQEVMDLGEKDTALMVVVDGVGHGAKAAATTIRILDCLRAHFELDLAALVKKCHEAASGLMGATIGIALLDQPNCRVHYLGMGDVTMQIVTKNRERSERISYSSLAASAHGRPYTRTLINNNGIIGYRIPDRLQTNTYDYVPGDVFLLGTDGIQTDFNSAYAKQGELLEVEAVAESIVSAFGSDRDDATVIVAM